MLNFPTQITEDYSTQEIKFTGIVVTFNDDRYLRSSLSSISFCDQIIVIDLGSFDNSVAIANEMEAEVIEHRWVPIADQIRQKALKFSKNQWVIFIDPDEVFP